MTYELARVDEDGTFDLIGDCSTPADAYVLARECGPGNYAGTGDPRGGHYEEEIRVLEDGTVLLRHEGDQWTRWDG